MASFRKATLQIVTALLLCGSFACFDSAAQTYPVKPIRLVIGFTPGGVADAIARLLAQQMAQALGQQVVIENRSGASGAIAYEMVAKSPPDGYTLLIVGATAAVLPSLRANLPYDLEKDLAPVALVAISPFVLAVHPSVPVSNVKELVAMAKSRPGKLTYGTVGAGSPPHMMAELFRQMANIDIVHVPYRGGGENAIAIAAGEVDMSFLSVPSLRPLMAAHKLKPLAISSSKRVSFVSSIPTIDESGLPGYDYSNWNGVVGPTGIPKDIIARLNAIIVKAVAKPEMKEAFNQQGLEPQTSSPAELGAFIHNEVAKNARLAKSMGMKAQ